jgi:SAM-dependent methyltransferase
MRSARPRYGVDGGNAGAPIFGAVLAGLGGATWWASRRHRYLAASAGGLAAAAVTAIAAGYYYSTGPGKRAVWSQILDDLDLRGDERVLDVGCGRGAVLMLAAHRLPAGRATGADIWRRRDQSGNSHRATARNAAAEGVADRVELADADARDLPFPDASFDVVVSNLVIHNIGDDEGRRRALLEAVRVLRPGGRLRIVDPPGIHHENVLTAAGCADVTARPLDWRTSYGLPTHRMTLVTATKPS